MPKSLRLSLIILLAVFVFLANFIYRTIMFYSGTPDRGMMTPAISSDGHYVVFRSRIRLTNDTPRDRWNIFRYDRTNGTLTCYPNAWGGDGANYAIVLSKDGNQMISSDHGYDFIKRSPLILDKRGFDAFYKMASYDNIRLSDKQKPAIEKEIANIKANSNKKSGKNRVLNSMPLGGAIISANESSVVNYSSDMQVILYNRHQKDIQVISISPKTQQNANRPVDEYGLIVSPDGRFICFVSQATNLTCEDTPFMPDVYVYDREIGNLVCASSTNRRWIW